MKLGVGAAVVGDLVVAGDVDVDGDTGTIVAVGVTPAGDAALLAAPGFVDLQVNGVAGVDLATAGSDGYRRAGDALLAAGVTAYQPTFVTAPVDSLVASLGRLRTLPREVAAAPRVLGGHLEGPFLSPARLGAHRPDHRLDPDRDVLNALLAAGPLRHITMAPELPGGIELIRHLVASGVVVSCGHSDADAESAHAAFDAGATTVTHLFNAMRPPSHRDPGLVYAALAREDVYVQAIVDGLHLSREAATVAWRAAAGRFALVSDVVATPPGDDGAVRLPNGTLAGSARLLDQAVRNLIELGAPLTGAVAAASTVPARIARRADLGALAPGAPADVVVLDDGLSVRRTYVGGVTRFAA